jgi:hypothetical protein
LGGALIGGTLELVSAVVGLEVFDERVEGRPVVLASCGHYPRASEERDMRETTHTPGPWRLEWDAPEEDDDSALVIGANNATVCDLGNVPHSADAYAEGVFMANARLIAAAPEVLAALKQIVAEYKSLWDEIADQDSGSPNTPCYARALDVIAKAEGLPPHTPK